MKLKNRETGKVFEVSRRARLRERILLALSNEESLSTEELNDALGSKCCYSACRGLQELGLVESSLEKKYTRWDPVTGQVITKENYDVIVLKSQEARERLTKKMRAEGLTDEEIAEKLSELIDPRSLASPFRDWRLSKNWTVLKQGDDA